MWKMMGHVKNEDWVNKEGSRELTVAEESGRR